MRDMLGRRIRYSIICGCRRRWRGLKFAADGQTARHARPFGEFRIMILLPVIGRELRATARHPFTYQLRMAGVAVLLVVSLFFLLDYSSGSNSGSILFESLHRALFWAIWILVPMLTADCL